MATAVVSEDRATHVATSEVSEDRATPAPGPTQQAAAVTDMITYSKLHQVLLNGFVSSTAKLLHPV